MTPRVLVSGSRLYESAEVITRELGLYPKGTVIIHGAARGADTLAGEAAEALGFEVVTYPADWWTYGRGAGPRRNTQMLVEGEPTELIVFHEDLTTSVGTLDMATKCAKVGLPFRAFDSSGQRRSDWEQYVRLYKPSARLRSDF